MMEFLKILDDLSREFSDNLIIRKNGTILLGPDDVPNCRHMLFEPLTEEYAKTYLINEYKNKFPEDYIAVLLHTNGANLYNVRLKISDFNLAHPLFAIFGLPRTAPSDRAQNMEEPFDLRIEDLARHKLLPDTWIKCGTYIKDYNFDVQNDIFIDTLSNKVYSCRKNQKDIVDSWSDLDNCFCSIFESFGDCKYEYKL